MSAFQQTDDARGAVLAKGKIADILQARGELDEALRIRTEEELPVYERLGDVREKAVTQGKIADILRARGELDEALLLHEQCLAVYRRLGDVGGIAHVRSSIARIRLRRSDLDSGEIDQIRDDLAQAFEILTKLGRPDGIGAVGLLFAEVLVMGGDQKATCEVLAKAEAAFEKIDDTVAVERVRRFRERIEGDSTLDQKQLAAGSWKAFLQHPLGWIKAINRKR